MKVRIGVALGGRALPGLDRFGQLLDALEDNGFDSVWLPETFLGGTVDPLIGLSFAAARVSRLKLGTHIVMPGRNPFLAAKQLAQLDQLSGGRLLLTFVAGINEPAERLAQGLPDGNRTTWFDEQLPRIRRWWAGETLDGLALDSLPRQSPLEVWLGGQSPSALTRAGRLGDGWLPGAITVEQAVEARGQVDAAASAAGRVISPEHFGANVAYTLASELPTVPALPRGTGDPRDVTVAGAGPLRELLTRWIAAGFSKIVVRPLVAPDDWAVELQALARAVGDLQT